MSALRERLARLRWMAVPLVAYLLITLVLPAANGAARRDDFAGHAGWVLAGCAVMVAIALVVGALVEFADVSLGRKR